MPQFWCGALRLSRTEAVACKMWVAPGATPGQGGRRGAPLSFVEGRSAVSALQGLRVLDLSRVLAGPFATQMFADLGAEVWKVEPLWGDETRAWGPPFTEGESAYYLSTNRGKQSVAVNLKDERGSALVRRLAAKADVFVENYKTGDLARFGLDYDTLSDGHPELIYVSITGFGQTGPRAAEPGYDAALQGMSGIMSVTGEPGGPPVKIGVAWIDALTGLTATAGVLAAYVERLRSGAGQRIDLSLFDVGFMAMVNQAQSYLATGEPPGPLGSAHPQIVPYQAFEASDGWLMLAVGNDRQYQRAVEALGEPDLWDDERFHTNAGRVAHRDELVPKIAASIAARSKDDCLRLFNEAGVPATPINNLREVLADPQAADRGLVWEQEHPKLGVVPLAANALQHMSRTPARPSSHPPLLGEHSRSLLAGELGLGDEELDALEADGVIKTADGR